MTDRVDQDSDNDEDELEQEPEDVERDVTMYLWSISLRVKHPVLCGFIHQSMDEPEAFELLRQEV